MNLIIAALRILHWVLVFISPVAFRRTYRFHLTSGRKVDYSFGMIFASKKVKGEIAKMDKMYYDAGLSKTDRLSLELNDRKINLNAHNIVALEIIEG